MALYYFPLRHIIAAKVAAVNSAALERLWTSFHEIKNMGWDLRFIAWL
jgi:hypothetical protein